MTESQLNEHFPELGVMDFKVLCNIAYHGEVPSSYTLRNIASRSRVSYDNMNEALSHIDDKCAKDGAES